MSSASVPHPRRDGLRVAIASRALPLVAGYGLNLLSTPIIVSSLGLAQFGVWALTGALAQYGGLLDLGVTRSVTRFTAMHLARGDAASADRVLSTAAVAVLVPGAVLLALALALASPVASTMNIEDASGVRVLLVVSVVILLSGQYLTIVNGAAFGREVQLLPNVVFSACNVALNIGSAGAAFLTKDLISYAVSVAVLNVLSTITLATVLHFKVIRFRPKRPSWTVARELVTFGLKSQSVPLAEILLFQFSKIVIGIGGGPAAVGAYELGSRLALGFRTLGALPFGAVLAPQTRRYMRDGDTGVRAEIDRLAPAVVGVAIFFPVVGAASAPALLTLWLGTYEYLTLVVLTGLCLAFTANMLSGLQSTAADAIGRPGLNARSAGITAALNVALGLGAFVLFGTQALVAATAFALVVGSVYGMWLVQRALQTSLHAYLRRIAAPVVIALISGLAARGVILLIPTADNRWEALLAVSVAFAVFASFYGTGMIWTRSWSFDLRTFVQRRGRRARGPGGVS